jgi:two-component system cell cycle response regulator
VVAERLRVAVQAQPVETGGPRLFLTASVGVCLRTPDMDSVDALIKCADDALYLPSSAGAIACVLMQDEPGGG